MALTFGIILATAFAIAGYFVLAASTKAEGPTRTVGKYLSIWVFVLAGLILVGSATAPMFMGPMMGRGMGRGHDGDGMMMPRRDSPAPGPARGNEAQPPVNGAPVEKHDG